MQVSDIFKIKEGDRVVRWGIYFSAGFKDEILEVSEVYYNADGEKMFHIEASVRPEKQYFKNGFFKALKKTKSRDFSDYSHRYLNEKILLYNFFEV